MTTPTAEMLNERRPTERRIAVLSMDIEDWYHLDYFERGRCDQSYSMLDGLEVYLEFLEHRGLSSSFFWTGELAGSMAPLLRQMKKAGHDIGSHTYTHRRPLTLSSNEFGMELDLSKRTLEDIVGAEVEGFRAPCFSLDDEGLSQVVRAGYRYDSSRIALRDNRRVGRLELQAFRRERDGVFCDGDFFEFELPTQPVLGRNIPVSGGGYLRLLPWTVMRAMVEAYLESHSTYFLYIHPFELSRLPPPPRQNGLGWFRDRRFRGGLGRVEGKLKALVDLLMSRGFEFTTFSKLRRALLLEADGR
jgi:polysaccharide deacetylase family protein (PEP-CTERM system associated)